MSTKNVNIEQLIAKKESISNAALQNALKRVEEEKAKQQEEQLLKHLTIVQLNTERAVEQLRKARAVEKAHKEYLQAIANAQEKFYKDADIEAYNKESRKAAIELSTRSGEYK